ncbi:MAG: butyrate kinase [Desulfuromonadales bacterium]|nr:butyrate kinase [Desulfuromonadales bacterium]
MQEESVSSKILVVNLGSTSTKVGIFAQEKMQINQGISHSVEELSRYRSILDQYELRQQAIFSVLGEHAQELDSFCAIACRGGNTKPVPGGIYRICPAMIEDMKSGRFGQHPNIIGGIVAHDIGRQKNIPVFTVDPPTTDELCAYARYSGIPQLRRQSSFHALSQKATARKIAAQLGKSYDQVNLIVAHLGGGISVGAHLQGKVVDVNNALDGDGPFSPERAGSLPTGELIKLCFSGQYTQPEVMRLIQGGGGLVAYLGTTDARAIEQRIAGGDEEAAEVYQAMIYQVAKEIGACAAVLEGRVDAIALTGSLAYSDLLVTSLSRRVSFLAPLYVDPGENEMEALAGGVLRYLTNQESLSNYQGVPG